MTESIPFSWATNRGTTTGIREDVAAGRIRPIETEEGYVLAAVSSYQEVIDMIRSRRFQYAGGNEVQKVALMRCEAAIEELRLVQLAALPGTPEEKEAAENG